MGARLCRKVPHTSGFLQPWEGAGCTDPSGGGLGEGSLGTGVLAKGAGVGGDRKQFTRCTYTCQVQGQSLAVFRHVLHPPNNPPPRGGTDAASLKGTIPELERNQRRSGKRVTRLNKAGLQFPSGR